MTPDSEKLEALLAKATPAPWGYRTQEYDDWGFIRGPERQEGGAFVVALARAGQSVGEGQLLTHRVNGTDPYGPNAELIVALRNEAPALLARITHLEKQVAEMRGALERVLGDAPADGNARPHPSTYWSTIHAVRGILNTTKEETDGQ